MTLLFNNSLFLMLSSLAILAQLIENVNTGHVDAIVQSFTNYVYDCACSAFSKTGKRKSSYTVKPKNPWFDNKCIQARNEFKRARNQFLKSKSDASRQHFVTLRSQYNKIKNKAKRQLLRRVKKFAALPNLNQSNFGKRLKKITLIRKP